MEVEPFSIQKWTPHLVISLQSLKDTLYSNFHHKLHFYKREGY